jgi:hypothetical protein
MKRQIRPVGTWEEYQHYRKAIPEQIDILLEHYRKNPERFNDKYNSDPEVIHAKKVLIKTLYEKLNGVNGVAVPVELAHNPRINEVFQKYFPISHLKTSAKDKYLAEASRYEEKILVAEKSNTPLTDLIAAGQVAWRKSRTEEDPALRSRYACIEKELHQTIDDRFEAAPMAEFEQTAKIFQNNILMQYQQYCWRMDEFKSYLASQRTQETTSNKAKSSQPALRFPE